MHTTVIIPSTQRPQRLENSLRTLRASATVEIVCVVECDPVSAALAASLCDILIERDERRGGVYGWNQGAGVASGDVFVLGSDDITWTSGWLEELERVYLDNPSAGVVGFNDGLADHPQTYAYHFAATRAFVVSTLGGCFLCPHYFHVCVDKEICFRARAASAYVFAPLVVVEHRHPMQHGVLHVKPDAVYKYPKEMGWIEHDHRLFTSRRRAGFPNDYEPQVFDAA